MKLIFRWQNGRHVDVLFRRKRREGVERFYASRGRPLFAFDYNTFDAC